MHASQWDHVIRSMFGDDHDDDWIRIGNVYWNNDFQIEGYNVISIEKVPFILTNEDVKEPDSHR
jgi:hypothetical protein